MAATDTAAAARFLLVRGMPLVVVDLEPVDDDVPPLLADDLFRRLVDGGLLVLPRFLGLELPKGARVGFTVTADELVLEDEAETKLLRVPRGALERAWLDRALALKGTMLVVGRDLGIDPDQSGLAVAESVEAGCADRRVAGAVVGVAEPRTGLPLLFG
ncbi:MAG: hypothetical protein KY457_06990 [Actinobacteria bacterium]|nr:hypothetical protein [Actinomycetota bacterium]